MIYLLSALGLLALGFLLRKAWERERDPVLLARGVALVAAGFVLTLLARTMIVYKPLMVLHLAALILYWYAAVRYLAGRGAHPAFLLAPGATALLFFAAAWFFREV